MYLNQNLYVAHSANGPIHLVGKMCNRHGLIAGATGTGKTVTLQVLAETFSQAGVPCFMADMKGDLSGISQPGKSSSFIEKRQVEFGISNPEYQACPVRFFDVFGEQGFPMRTTVSAMGPQLLSRLMGKMLHFSQPSMATSPRLLWEPFKEPSWHWRVKVVICSSESRPLMWKTLLTFRTARE